MQYAQNLRILPEMNLLESQKLVWSIWNELYVRSGVRLVIHVGSGVWRLIRRVGCNLWLLWGVWCVPPAWARKGGFPPLQIAQITLNYRIAQGRGRRSSDGKKSTCSVRDLGLIPRLGRCPWRKTWKPTLVFLPGDFPWTEEPGGLQSMGSQKSDTT